LHDPPQGERGYALARQLESEAIITTIRVPSRERWTAVSRQTINDTRLSFKARGILLWLLDKPDDWVTSAERIESQGIEGREAVRSALKELEQFGYLVRTKYRDADGTWRSEWHVHEVSSSAPPTAFRSWKPVDGKPSDIEKTETKTETRLHLLPRDGLARFPTERHQCDQCASGWIEQEDGTVLPCPASGYS
jgi:hypothetical protein